MIIGSILQIATIIISLVTNWLLSKKGREWQGFLVALLCLPIWMAFEIYYQTWVYLALNPIYAYIWYRGFRNHRKQT